MVGSDKNYCTLGGEAKLLSLCPAALQGVRGSQGVQSSRAQVSSDLCSCSSLLWFALLAE